MAAALLVAAAAPLAVATRELGRQQFPFWVGALLVAGVATAAGATLVGSARERLARPMPVPRHPRVPVLGVSCVFALGAWFASGSGDYTILNLALWPAALAAWLFGWWPVHRPEWRLPRPAASTLLALAFVVALAVFFRFHLLHEVPGEPTSDHAEKLLDIRDVIHGDHSIYFQRNGGREPAQFYVSAALIKWFGLAFSWQTLKLGTAAVGVLAVVAILFLGRELAGLPGGIAAATLAAVSRWPVGDDRLGLRFPYAILASALTLLFLLRYLRGGDRRHALAAGVLLGLGLHGYATYRVWVVGLVLFFAVAAFGEWKRAASWRRCVADCLLAYGTAFMAAIPLVHYAVQHPDVVFARMTDRAAASFTADQFLRNTWNGLLAFHWRGDVSWNVAVPNQEFLDPVMGALLLGGAAIVVVLAFRRSLAALTLVLVSQVLLLSSTLNFGFPIENPSANRLSVAVPLVFAVAALPVAVFWDAVGQSSLSPRLRPLLRPLAAVALGAALAVAARIDYDSYFHDYRRTYLESAENTSEVAAAIRAEHASLERTFLVGYPHWLDARNLALALGDLDWWPSHAVFPGAVIPDSPSGGKAVYALFDADVSSRRELERLYAGGRYQQYRSAVPGDEFGLYVVDPSRAGMAVQSRNG
jgi:hypothetical protein